MQETYSPGHYELAIQAYITVYIRGSQGGNWKHAKLISLILFLQIFFCYL